jgi:neuroligin
LFHRAILLSGSALSSWALVEQPVTYATRLARQLNCSVPADTRRDHERIVDCLRAAPLDALMRADVTPPAYMSAFGPSVDGVVIRAGFRRELVAGSRKRSSGTVAGLAGVSGQLNRRERDRGHV